MLWGIAQLLLSPAFCWMHEAIFHVIHYDVMNLVGPLEVILIKVWALPNEWSPWSFSLFRLVHIELPTICQFQFKGSSSCGGFWTWVSAPVSCDSLYPPVCLFIFGGSSWSYHSPAGLRSILVFQFAQLFTC